jgi:hypothetical protein
MKIASSLQHSQGPTISSNYENQINAVYIILLTFIKNRFNIILLSMSSSSSFLLLSDYSELKKFCYQFLITLVHSTCPVHFNIFDVIMLIKTGRDHT